MIKYFPKGEYHTSDSQPRLLGDRLFLNTRFYFITKFVNILLKVRKTIKDKGIERLNREEWAQASYEIFKLIEGCGGKFHITGIDNLAKIQGPVVFVSNHMSTLETMVFPSIIAPYLDSTFVVKDSLVKHFVFGPIVRSREPVVVGRKNPREDLQTVMREGQDRLEKGYSLIIFPQSTRTTNFIPEEFNSLGVKLAKKNNVQVVPIAIKTDFWENGKIMKDLGPIYRNRPIYIAIGEALTIEGNGKDEHNHIVDFIDEEIKGWELNNSVK
ncbi:lysophospholipid acyltransferase family protein [Alkaliphilus serpentinus]|uniref:1-acyl-sn-glycerol-3-phosphate acyltransferase n=1 Tax=Alkaliphilus serpentinus TaxID=1482731 RepID=A0A833HPX6_9FIRM|nr:lysophospholipid acyltransferase family protein [Alkaliphilus serpentinus]KAB3531395.1 1-acyl-sn-glycerol-3-phosphate acyltransferase [Alkaliphilus serpentinus]